jgi:hypothetical protein
MRPDAAIMCKPVCSVHNPVMYVCIHAPRSRSQQDSRRLMARPAFGSWVARGYIAGLSLWVVAGLCLLPCFRN